MIPLREGDLPNRNPYVPDEYANPELFGNASSPAKTDRLLRKHKIDLRQYDIAERDWLFKDKGQRHDGSARVSNETSSHAPATGKPCAPSESTTAAHNLGEAAGDSVGADKTTASAACEGTPLRDLRTLPHWVNEIETNASRNMPPGGYPLDFEGATRDDWDPTHGDDESTSSSSHEYARLRSAILEEYGQAAVSRIVEIDKFVNFSGKEPALPEPQKEKGMIVPRYYPDGSLEAFVPWEPDELDEPIDGLEHEALHEKLWQYARDGRVNGTRALLEAGADANAMNEYTNTALHFAAIYGWSDVLEVHVCSMFRSYPSVMSLMRHVPACDISCACCTMPCLQPAACCPSCVLCCAVWSMPCLYSRARVPHAPPTLSRVVLQVLLQHGADVDVVNDAEMTPLHYAAYNNHTAAAWALLRHNASTTKVNLFNFTAADLAESHNFEVLVSLFDAWRDGEMETWKLLHAATFSHASLPGNYNSRVPHGQPRYCEWHELDGSLPSDPAHAQPPEHAQPQTLIPDSLNLGAAKPTTRNPTRPALDLDQSPVLVQFRRPSYPCAL